MTPWGATRDGLLARSATGGFRPRRRQRPSRQLRAAEREEISRGLAADESLRQLARRLGRAPSTISREVARNGGRDEYRASAAEAAAGLRAARPKPCRLAIQPRLQRAVERQLRADWSPQQITAWLRQIWQANPLPDQQ